MKRKLTTTFLATVLTVFFTTSVIAQEASSTPSAVPEAESPPTYSLTVTTTPKRAMVRILNIAPRYTPGMQLPPGEYMVEASRNGYGTVREVVTIVDSDVSVHFELPAPEEFFTLTVKSSPPGADVRILNIRPAYEDGMKLPPGKYHLQVSMPGYVTTSKWITHGGSDRVIYVALEKEGGAQE